MFRFMEGLTQMGRPFFVVASDVKKGPGIARTARSVVRVNANTYVQIFIANSGNVSYYDFQEC